MTREPIPAELPAVFAPPVAPLEAALPLEVFAARPQLLRTRPPTLPARPPSRPGTLRPGTIVDKYRIEELLGVGGFAAVYRATHLLLRSTVALKLMRPDVLARRPGLATQLLHEARFAARIEHPNVVRVFDVTHTDEITYIVMEFIRGPSLARLIADRGPLPLAMVARIGLDTAAGLEAGLQQGLIHRDIKPPNILVGDQGVARIVDLGLANAIGVRDEGPLRNSTLVGTRGYMSPEQLADPRSIDFRSDIYALGVTLREAVTGVAPSGDRRRSARRAAVPPELVRILEWMTADSPDDRPSSYRELREALEAASAAGAASAAHRSLSAVPDPGRPDPNLED